MCGSTSAQNELQNEQISFYQQAQQEAATTYQEDQKLLGQITSVYEPILQKGPNQEGYSAEELESLNSQAVQGTATNYGNAAKAVNEQIAGQGGGDIALPTGSQEQLRAEVATSAAGQESQEESQIQQSDYEQGYKEFMDAGNMLEAASGQLSPTSYENAATESGSAASTTANEIAQENNSWINAALGAAGSIGGAVVSENPKGIFS